MTLKLTPERLQVKGGLSREGVDALWQHISRMFNIEDRAYFEREAPKIWEGHPSVTPLMMAVHHMWKRNAKVDDLLKQVETLTQELETERMRLAACSTAALGNTPETIAQRIAPGHLYYSASYGDVCRAVDREMTLTQERDTVRELNARLQTADEGVRKVISELRQERDRAREVALCGGCADHRSHSGTTGCWVHEKEIASWPK